MKITKLIVTSVLLLFFMSMMYSQVITLTSPNGGENWDIGATRDITWTCTDIITGQYKITLWDGATNLGIIADNIPNGRRSIPWTVGALTGGMAVPAGTNYKIKIRVKSETPMDFSDRVFSLNNTTVSSLVITNPMETGAFAIRGDITIEWTSEGITGNLRVELDEWEGSQNYLIRSSHPYNSTPLVYTIPDEVVPGTYRIKISQGGLTVYSGRIGILAYTPPGVYVREPHGGETRNVGRNLSLIYGTPHIDTDVKIELVRYGRVVGTIVERKESRGGYHTWNCKDLVEHRKVLAGGGYKIRVSTIDGLYQGDSEGTFTLTNPDGIWVFQPHEGEIWDVGSTKQIKWNLTGMPGRTVEININYGDYGYRLAERVPITDKQFTWQVGRYIHGDMIIDSGITEGVQIQIRTDDGDPLRFSNSKLFKFRKGSPKPFLGKIKKIKK